MLNRLLVKAVHLSRLHRLFTPWYGGHTSIFLLHRVLPGPRSGMPTDNLELTPEFLERFLKDNRRAGWRFITLDYLVEQFDDCVSHGKNVVLTLDDGYRDNYQYAWPIFREQKVPFTLYLANAFPNGKADLWWYTLADLLKSHGRIELRHRGVSLTLDRDQVGTAFARFRDFYQPLAAVEQQEVMAKLRTRYPGSSGAYAERLWMNWDEVCEMAADELCCIGCHTLTHRSLARLPREEAFLEMERSLREIEDAIGRPVRHFAYPYGKAADAGEREESLARELGFATAVTTRVGNLHAGHRDHLLMLPRIPLYEGGKNGMLSEIFRSGMYSAVTNGFRKVVTY